MKKNKKKQTIIVSAAAAVLVAGGIGAGVYSSEHITLKVNSIQTEYGESLSLDTANYFEGSKQALKKVKINASGVNTDQVGTYTLKATKGSKTYEISVDVQDTIAPMIECKKNAYIVVNKELSSTDILKKASDLAGIKSVSFKEAQVKTEEGKGEQLPTAVVKYTSTGSKQNTISVTDANGNATSKEITITVVPESVKSVKVETSINVVQDAKDVDYTKSVSYDKEEIKDVTVDSKAVDTTVPGEYDINYVVTTIKNEIVKIQATVTVVTPQEAQTIIKDGETVIGDKGEPLAKEETDKKPEEIKKEDSKTEVKEEKKDDSVKKEEDNKKQENTKKDPAKDTTATTKPSNNQSSAAKPDESKPAHTHTWVAQTKTVNHEATGHNVEHPAVTHVVNHEATGHEEPVYETRWVYICNDCGAVNPSTDHLVSHLLNGGKGSYHEEYQQIQTGTQWVQDSAAWTETVVDSPAWTEWVQDSAAWTETITTGYVCSGCGATK